MPKKMLFICAENLHRSRTAEDIFKDEPEFDVRSAGTSSLARNQVTGNLLNWADYIFVMDNEQGIFIKQNFPQIKKEIIVLNIDESYRYMDPELVQSLKLKIKDFFNTKPL